MWMIFSFAPLANFLPLKDDNSPASKTNFSSTFLLILNLGEF